MDEFHKHEGIFHFSDDEDDLKGKEQVNPGRELSDRIMTCSKCKKEGITVLPVEGDGSPVAGSPHNKSPKGVSPNQTSPKMKTPEKKNQAKQSDKKVFSMKGSSDPQRPTNPLGMKDLQKERTMAQRLWSRRSSMQTKRSPPSPWMLRDGKAQHVEAV